MCLITPQIPQQATDTSIFVGIEKLSENEPNCDLLRRRRDDVNTVSDASVTSGSQTSSSDNSRRRRRRNKKKHRKEPVDPVAKVEAELNLTSEEKSQYLALDCEMVGYGYKGKKSALARVTLVDWDHNIVYDEHVKPEPFITDYRTFVSGITKEDLDQAQYELESIREQVLKLIDGKILVGHGLKNDMRALGIQLPFYMVRDTAKYEPFQKARFDDGILWPQSLKTLSKNKLSRDIQMPGVAHCPKEDAAAAMDLYKVARRKWEKAMDYKIQRTREIERKQ